MGHYVYDGNRKQAIYPPEKQNILEMVEAIDEARSEHTLQSKEARLGKVG